MAVPEPEDLTLLLSDEVLVHVFSHLPTRELLLTVRGVCTRWRRVALDRICWRGRSVSVGFRGDPPLRLATRALELAPCLRSLCLKPTRLRQPPTRLRQPQVHDVMLDFQDALLATRCRIAELKLLIRRWREAVPFLRALPLLVRDLEELHLELPETVTAGKNMHLLELAFSGKRLQHLLLRCPSVQSRRIFMGEESILQDVEGTVALKSLVVYNVDVEVVKRLLRLSSTSLESVVLSGLDDDEAAEVAGVLPECEKITSLILHSRRIGKRYRSVVLDYFKSASAAKLEFLRLDVHWTRNKRQNFRLPDEDFIFFPILLLEALASSHDETELETLCVTYVVMNKSSNSKDYTYRFVQMLVALRNLSILTLNPGSDCFDTYFFDCMAASLTNHLQVIDLRFAVRCRCRKMHCLIPEFRRLVRGCPSMHIIGVRLSHKCRDNPAARCLCCKEHPPHGQVAEQGPSAAPPPRRGKSVFGLYAHRNDLHCHICRMYTVTWLSVGEDPIAL